MPGRKRPTGEPRGGVTIDVKRAQRHLALVVRDRIPEEVLVEWQVQIWKGHDARIAEDAEGLYATCYCHDPDPGEPARGSILPTLEQRNRAAQWLADRGHGQAPQHHVVESMISKQHTHVLKLDQLGTRGVMEILGVMRRTLGVGVLELAPPAASELVVASEPAEVIEDAEILPGVSTPVAGTDDEPASTDDEK